VSNNKVLVYLVGLVELMYVFSVEQCYCGLSPPVSRTRRTFVFILRRSS